MKQTPDIEFFPENVDSVQVTLPQGNDPERVNMKTFLLLLLLFYSSLEFLRMSWLCPNMFER